MPKSDNQKLKIFYIRDYLEQNSDEDHPVRAQELIDMLQSRYGIQCERKTIYSDIEALKEYGLDILSIHGKNGGYYLASRSFELPELKLLIGAVQSSRYLTEKKSKELIEKLCKLCSNQDASLVRRDVRVSGRVKTMNETIYYNVDAIQDAISMGKQISFRYFNWGLNGQRIYREKSYAASPYGLCQDNENCYLLAWSERHGITSYRVDRMSHIQILEEKRIPCPELTGAAFNEHANRLFKMYSGEIMNVKLEFDIDLINVVIDQFGKDTMLIPQPDGKHFTFTVPVALSPMFFSWVIGFGDRAKILYPQKAVDACKELCRNVLAQY